MREGAAGVGMCGMGPVNLTRVTRRGPWKGNMVGVECCLFRRSGQHPSHTLGSFHFWGMITLRWTTTRQIGRERAGRFGSKSHTCLDQGPCKRR